MDRIDILAPDLPESIVDATIIKWHKKPGDSVQPDEILVEIETDKVILEVPSPEAGVVETLLESEGAIVTSRQILARLKRYNRSSLITADTSNENVFPVQHPNIGFQESSNHILSPAARRLAAKHNLNPENIKNANLGNRLTRSDIEEYITRRARSMSISSTINTEIEMPSQDNRTEKRVPMTRLRKRLAERLLEAKKSTAMLTTFNEVNMKAVIDLRNQYGNAFEKRHGVRLGFMSFYIKAVLEALKYYPEINASIDGEDIVYHNYFDISIAVSTPRGLVTPVIKNINTMKIVDIEKKIKEFSIKGRSGKLKVEELTGGNFTITNGGIFGSLMSTPIINPPQAAILGMHAIKDRPMAVGNQVVILPMMYLALSYDHRLIDGKESVSFLITVKEIIESPVRLLLDI